VIWVIRLSKDASNHALLNQRAPKKNGKREKQSNGWRMVSVF
jgi:hypothetical protein